MAAIRVLSDIFAHHQEHLNCITASGITHVCRCQLLSWECWNWLNARYSWWWAKISLGTCRAAME